MPGRCQIIGWDRSCHVIGTIVESGRDGVCRIVTEVEAQPGGTFGEQLTEIREKLHSCKADAIVVSGYIEGALFLEVALPPTSRSEARNSLEFELPRQLPMAMDDTVWFFRPVGKTKDRSRFRIFICPRNAWENLLNSLREAGVQFDAWCQPFMAVQSDRDGEDLYFPDCLPGFVWRCAEGNPAPLRELRVVEADFTSPANQPSQALLVAEYALSDQFARDRRFLSNQPGAMRPARLRLVKFAVAALAAVCAILFGIYWFLVWDDQVGRLNAIHQEIADIEYTITAEQEGMEQLLEIGQTAQKLLEGIDEADPLQAMALLGKLPPHAWLTTLGYSNNKIALSINVKGETDSVVSCLNEQLPGYTVENLRQKLNNDDTATLTVTLQKRPVEAAP